jgi:hypothetical protein
VLLAWVIKQAIATYRSRPLELWIPKEKKVKSAREVDITKSVDLAIQEMSEFLSKEMAEKKL